MQYKIGYHIRGFCKACSGFIPAKHPRLQLLCLFNLRYCIKTPSQSVNSVPKQAMPIIFIVSIQAGYQSGFNTTYTQNSSVIYHNQLSLR